MSDCLQKWHLETFGLTGEIRAHMRTILCLSLSEDEDMLLSSAGDGLVNVRSMMCFINCFG